MGRLAKSVLNTGDKIGKWTIVGNFETIGKWSYKLWECKCDCGTLAKVSDKNLRNGKTLGCVECRRVDYINPENMINKKYGTWTAIKFIGTSKDRQNFLFECQCDCGNTSIKKSSYLRKNRASLCAVCIPKTRHETVERHVWKKILWAASVRNIKVEISLDEILNLLDKQNYRCAISGVPINIAKDYIDYKNGISTASLDRIDSDGSYKLDNVQWVHKIVNKMKWELTDHDLINWCKLIVEHNHKKLI